ncbi:hypothetical protein FSU_3269 [Fibrobacter succinogenes subsp. succinogenes S85]|jgi:hypothetical protein|uniref:Uncharacterized protein n=1 Tax=Fibrobacter succinogenes (strain ATCC 19169 / S85) TaxID=59374 RepID=C9RN32_FIBSS|nr:hypothetical protein [Fibrobacter succinogenes]ACX76284.1 hypothetical protein Fisuc_2701 [Fibrobacter succinogenes subsp. succinogenes S85]ADL26247.1 hypothetical protein FSU_3269 [Fibrobacter succinogenes subsp. succinogenes S85]
MDLPKKLIGELYSERGSVVHSEMNSVIKTDHGKYLLVVKKTESLIVCCSINTNRVYFKPEESQPKILKRENDFLDHDSYVDCAQVFSIEMQKFYDNIKTGVFVPIGFLNNLAMAAVLRAGQTCRVLKKFEQEYFK